MKASINPHIGSSQASPTRGGMSGVAIEPGKTSVALQQGSVSHGARLRPGSPESGGRDIEQIRVEDLQIVGAQS
jgi:hypothetical protein